MNLDTTSSPGHSGDKLSPIKDQTAFESNICSQHARLVDELIEEIDFDLWYDKHYHDRHFLGDENGKRDGIDMNLVASLTKRSIRHLLLHAAINPGFSFINYKKADRNTRIVLQEDANGIFLNVVIEVHCIKLSYYEVTVKTAMRHEEFKFGDGQFILEINGLKSILKKLISKKLVDIQEI